MMVVGKDSDCKEQGNPDDGEDSKRVGSSQDVRHVAESS